MMADVEAAIVTAAEWLGEHAEMGAMTAELNVRRWPMPEFRYTIFYRLERKEARIDIRRFLDGRRGRDVRRVPK